jgi:hypothetical protein
MRPIGFILVLAAAAAAAPGVRAGSDAAARRAIQGRYDQFDRAYVKKEFQRVEAVFAPSCRLTRVGDDHSMKATRLLQGMKALSKALTVSQSKTRIVSIAPVKEGFAVRAVWTATSVYAPPGASGSAERPKPKPVSQKYRDTWAKTGQGWQIVQRVIER